MPFPLSRHGSITIDPPSSEELDLRAITTSVEQALLKANPVRLTVDDQSGALSFRCGVFRLAAFLVAGDQMILITSGHIHFSQQGGQVVIHYRITFGQMLVIVTLMAVVIWRVVSPADIRMPVLAWLWLFVGNYLLTLWRFPRFLRAAATTATTKRQRDLSL